MGERAFRIVLAGCIVTYAVFTAWNVHSTRMTYQPILDRMLDECRADRLAFEANYSMTCMVEP